MRYPDWAPKYVVEVHKDILRRINNRSEDTDLDAAPGIADIYNSLLREEYMKDAWASIERHWRHGIHSTIEKAYISFMGSVVNAWGGPSDDWDLLPKSDRRRNANKLAKNARELSRSITGSLDYPIIGLIPRKDVINGFGKILKKEIYDQAQTATDDEWMGHRHHLMFRSGFKAKISEVLIEWADWLDYKADEPPILPRPNSQEAKLTYFIRTLSKSNIADFGGPLHAVVANVVSVLFDRSDVDEEYVRKTVSRNPQNAIGII